MNTASISLPDLIEDETALDHLLTTPSAALMDFMRQLEGDIIVLGIAGKMGVTLGILAANAIRQAGVDKRVIGVARFSDEDARRQLEEHGVETIRCDLLDREAVAALPDAHNVIYMAGRKFGTQGQEDLTWAMNVTVPANAAHRFAQSRIVVFSTGCVYPLVRPDQDGCTEETPLSAVGEYAQSCLGRERVFAHGARAHGTPVCLFRLCYAIDLRYGVVHDIGEPIMRGEPVDLSAASFNCIWQGDANHQALFALQHAASPAVPLNVTGPETLSTRDVAGQLASLLDKPVDFSGDEGPRCYLIDASRALGLFGPPSVSAEQLIRWQAHWLRIGGRSLGKPTHFQTTDGNF